MCYTVGVGWLFLLFTLVPLLEIGGLAFVGARLGFAATLGLLILSGLVGSWFARREGLRVFRSWQRSLAEGRVPEQGLLDGLLVLVGGVLMVTPGFFTDLMGLALIVPPTRAIAGAGVRRWIERRIASGTIRVVRFGAEKPHSDVVRGRVVPDDP